MNAPRPEQIASVHEMLSCLINEPESLSVKWAVKVGIFVLEVQVSKADLLRVLEVYSVLFEMVKVFTEAQSYSVHIFCDTGAWDFPSDRREVELYTEH